jgi:hypothetical protein
LELEQIVVGLIVGIVITSVGGFVAYMFKGRERKDSVEKIAGEKKSAEIATASILEARTERIAEGVNKAVFEKIGNLFATLRSEILLRNQSVDSTMEARDTRIEQNKKDAAYASKDNREKIEEFIDNVFVDFKKDIFEILKKQAREIQRMQSITFAEDAHSFPSYMFDLDKDNDSEYLKDPIGLYKIQSQEDKDQQTEDNDERLRVEQDEKNTAVFETQQDKERLHEESGDATKVNDKKKLQKESEDVATAADKLDDDKST